MLAALLLLHRAQRAAIGYGSLVQLRNVGTSLYLSSGSQNPSDPGSPWEYFAAFGPCDENGYWSVGRVDLMPGTGGTSIRCGSIIRLAPNTRQTTLALSGMITAFGFVDSLETVDERVMWNVTCDAADFWRKDTYVQFRSITEGCFLGARLDHKTNGHIENRYPLECAATSTAATLWIAEAGLFPEDEMDEGAVLIRSLN
jgi:hypothetical protein